MALGAGVLFSINGTVSKLLLQGGFDAAQLTAFRAAGGCLGLLALSLLRQPARLRVRRNELPKLVGFGLSGFFLVPMLYFEALRRLPVGIALLLEFTGPLFVALWVRFGERQPVRRRLWVGIGACLAGLAMVAQIWTGRLNLDPVGVAAGLACAVMLAVYYVLGSRSVAGRDPLSATFWAFLVGGVAGAVVRPWWHFPVSILSGRSGGVPMWLLAAYFLTFGAIIAFVLVAASLKRLPPASVGIIGMVEPVLAAGFAWLALGERLTPAQIAGGAVILAGVVLAETARTTSAAPARSRRVRVRPDRLGT